MEHMGRPRIHFDLYDKLDQLESGKIKHPATREDIVQSLRSSIIRRYGAGVFCTWWDQDNKKLIIWRK